MERILMVAVVASVLGVGRPALAQPSSAKPDVKKLESEVDKLRSQLKEAETRYEKAKAAAEVKKPGPPFSPWGPGPWGAKGSEDMKKKMEEFKKFAESKGFDKKGPPPFGPWGRFDPAKAKEMKERFEKWKAESDKKPAAGAEARKGPPGGFGRGPGGYRPGERGRSPEVSRGGSDIERRLDRILHEVEDLRKELKKK